MRKDSPKSLSGGVGLVPFEVFQWVALANLVPRVSLPPFLGGSSGNETNR